MSGVQRRGPLGRVPLLRRVQHDQAERVSDLPALPVELLRVPAGHQDGDGDALWVGEILHGDPNHNERRTAILLEASTRSLSRSIPGRVERASLTSLLGTLCQNRPLSR